MAAWTCRRSVWPSLGDRPATRQLTAARRTSPVARPFSVQKLSHLVIESSHARAYALHDPGVTPARQRRCVLRREQHAGSTDHNRAHRRITDENKENRTAGSTRRD